jgi:hypothetical protein
MQKFISILMSLLILTSSMNVSLASHYCGGKLKEVAFTFGSEFGGCGMEEDSDTKACDTDSIDETCCQNHFQELIIEDDYSLSGNIDFKANVTALLPVLVALFYSAPDIHQEFLSYNPPENLSSVSLSLIRVFLI